MSSTRPGHFTKGRRSELYCTILRSPHQWPPQSVPSSTTTASRSSCSRANPGPAAILLLPLLTRHQLRCSGRTADSIPRAVPRQLHQGDTAAPMSSCDQAHSTKCQIAPIRSSTHRTAPIQSSHQPTVYWQPDRPVKQHQQGAAVRPNRQAPPLALPGTNERQLHLWPQKLPSPTPKKALSACPAVILCPFRAGASRPQQREPRPRNPPSHEAAGPATSILGAAASSATSAAGVEQHQR
ncbi:hypothetical protein NDU88_010579 [Pleurodeles waltl]|uniref:Uncharacterized protein n=1 Tax=Pleurodeles waltl TaxID=8319 RepID=A0AAV7Q2C1_PLEWA|nr:hypothetical protein NDU88_010579 [Pleurodeles waltl]